MQNHRTNITKYTSTRETRYINDDNQVAWNQFSEETVQLISRLLKKETRLHAKELLKLLGDQRRKIAKKLGHCHTNLGQDRFGSFRSTTDYFKFGSHLYEELDQTHRYYEQARQFCETYQIKPASPGLPVPDQEFKISLIKDKNKKNKPSIVYVVYPEIKDDMKKNFFDTIGKEIEALLTYDLINGVDKFLKMLGSLAYKMYRFLPYRLGTASIVNWLVRGIALSKDIIIGPENDKTDLPLDWKAFFTGTKEEYAKWYSKHAYQDVYLKQSSFELLKFRMKSKDSKANSHFSQYSLEGVIKEHTLKAKEYHHKKLFIKALNQYDEIQKYANEPMANVGQSIDFKNKCSLLKYKSYNLAECIFKTTKQKEYGDKSKQLFAETLYEFSHRVHLKVANNSVNTNFQKLLANKSKEYIFETIKRLPLEKQKQLLDPSNIILWNKLNEKRGFWGHGTAEKIRKYFETIKSKEKNKNMGPGNIEHTEKTCLSVINF